jgi:prevent-host-death family protein
MSSENIGIEKARKRLGDLVTAVQQGADVVLTRNGKPAARLTRYQEDIMTTYTAAIGLLSDVVAGDFCDVSVAENDILSYRHDANGDEVPVYSMGSNVVMDAVELPVRVDADDKGERIEDAADEALRAAGWRRVDGWESADNAAYATVECIA